MLSALMLRRDLLASPRRRRFYWKRLALLILCAVAFVWCLAISEDSAGEALGLNLFVTLAFASLVGLVFIGPISAAGDLMREKEERTLGLLLLTDITPWSVLAGRLLAGLLTLGLTVFALLPLAILAVSFGGVDTPQILGAFYLLACVLVFGICLGLFTASVARTENLAHGLVILLLLLLLAGLPVLLGGTGWYRLRLLPGLTLMDALSPFSALAEACYGRWLPALVCGSLFLGLGALAFLSSATLLRRAVVGQESGPAAAGRVADTVRRALRVSWRRARARAGGNPVLWRDYVFAHGGPRAAWARFGLFAFVVGSLLGLIAWRAGMKEDSVKEMTVGVTLWLNALIFGLGWLSLCGLVFHREKRGRTLELLLLSDLGENEILAGKLGAAFRTMLPWLIATAAAGLAGCLLWGGEREFGTVVAYGLGLFLAALFGLGLFATWCGLRFNRNVGFGFAVLLFLGWHFFALPMILSFLEWMLGFSDSIVFLAIILTCLAEVALGLVAWCLILRRLRLRLWEN
jgi:ABC-type transport system involved in multi-copper enzyme maturation permease subunit